MAKKISVDWSRSRSKDDLKPALSRYRKYLETLGLKRNTVKLYVQLAGIYLKSMNNDAPSPDNARRFYDSLHEKNMSKSSINNFAAAIIKYHKLIEKPVKLPFLRLNNSLPYYFNETDVLKVFNVCNNYKHYCMLNVIFYGCLRSGELCALNDDDYDSDHFTLRLRETKNGSDDFALLNSETAKILNKYLEMKPKLEINDNYPLFYTDYRNRWVPNQIYKMFLYYKEKAGITKKGAVHCFSRHTSATLMIANGADVRVVKEILRHRDINTTLRYAHVSDVTKRKAYEKFLHIGGDYR